jgi:hypothetical protein
MCGIARWLARMPIVRQVPGSDLGREPRRGLFAEQHRLGKTKIPPYNCVLPVRYNANVQKNPNIQH